MVLLIQFMGFFIFFVLMAGFLALIISLFGFKVSVGLVTVISFGLAYRMAVSKKLIEIVLPNHKIGKN